MLFLKGKRGLAKGFRGLSFFVSLMLIMNFSSVFAEEKSLTIDDVIDLIREEVPEESIIETINKVGVDFDLDIEATLKLVRAGASDTLIEAIESITQIEESQYLTLNDIIELIEEKVLEKDIINQVKKNKVDFDLDTKATLKLVRAGASNELIEAIDGNRVRKCAFSLMRVPLLQGITIPGNVKITYPPDCTDEIEGGKPLIVEGTYSKLKEDIDIWILVYTKNAKYYPQSDDACNGVVTTKYKGKWFVTVYPGVPDMSEVLYIVAVVTDKDTSNFFKIRLRAWCKAGEYTGLSANELSNKGIMEKDFITIKTKAWQ